jgi:integrase
MQNNGNGLPRSVIRALEGFPLEIQREAVLQWVKELHASGRSNATLELYSSHLKMLGRTIAKPFENLSREEVADYLGKFENVGTRNSVGIVLKNFLKWLNKGCTPDSISWWSAGKVDLTLCANDILTEEEIQRLINYAATFRDKALISVLYDSGARIGSILKLRRMDVQFDEYGAIIHLRSDKTGRRRIRVVNAVPILRDHLNSLPDKRQEAGIWFTHDWKPLGYQGALLAIKDAGRRAGLTKPVRPHMLRHARATEFARKNVSEAAAKAQFGWAPNSSMWMRYTHLNAADIDREVLRVSGIKMEESSSKNKSPLRPIKCPACGRENDSSYTYCSACAASLLPGAPLTAKPKSLPELLDRWKELKAANKIGQEKIEIEDELSKVITGIIENFDLVMQTFKPTKN